MTAFLWGPAILLLNLAGHVTTGHVDAHRLWAHAESVGVAPVALFGIAWEESRDGRSGNRVLGQGRLRTDTLADGTVRRQRVCRELGRLQMNPCINWVRVLGDSLCTSRNLRTSYDINLHCGARNLRRLREQRGSYPAAFIGWNGRGPMARAYRDRVLAYIGRLAVDGLP